MTVSNFSGSFSSIINSPRAPAAVPWLRGVVVLQGYLEFLSEYCPCLS